MDFMGRRLLVTGYGGFVAGSVVKQAEADWDVIALSRSKIANGREDITPIHFDLREIGRLRQAFEEVQPAAVIHTAAIANIDRCQSHQEEAEAINVGVTGHLAELCRQHGARMVFCSTDTVFDGKQGMYVEEDVPRPLNYYAETKVRAEQIVRDRLDNMVVARLSLVMGFPLIGAGNSFLAGMIASFQQEIPVPMPENEIRTPLDVVTLGRALLELAGSDFTGILHLAGNTRLNRYDMGVQIAEFLGFPRALVQPINSNAAPDRAPRPEDASLDNSKATRVLKTPLLSLADGLRLIMKTVEK
jgi:dTDP-4-dehydrorhamnose reductase